MLPLGFSTKIVYQTSEHRTNYSGVNTKLNYYEIENPRGYSVWCDRNQFNSCCRVSS